MSAQIIFNIEIVTLQNTQRRFVNCSDIKYVFEQMFHVDTDVALSFSRKVHIYHHDMRRPWEINGPTGNHFMYLQPASEADFPSPYGGGILDDDGGGDTTCYSNPIDIDATDDEATNVTNKNDENKKGQEEDQNDTDKKNEVTNITNDEKEGREDQNQDKESSSFFIPLYQKLSLYLKIFGLEDTPFPGFQLLQMRSEKGNGLSFFDPSDMTSIKMLKTELQECCLDAFERKSNRKGGKIKRDSDEPSSPTLKQPPAPASPILVCSPCSQDENEEVSSCGVRIKIEKRSSRRMSQLPLQPRQRLPLQPIKPILHKKKKQTVKRWKVKCCFAGCSNTDATLNSRKGFFRIPAYPTAEVPSASDRLAYHESYHTKMEIRKIFMRACGLPKSLFEKKDLRICPKHSFDRNVSKGVVFSRQGKKYSHKFSIKKVPTSQGVKETHKTQRKSRGLGRDRLISNYLLRVRQEEKKEEAGGDLSWALLLQAQMTTPSKESSRTSDINPVIREVAGIRTASTAGKGRKRLRKSFGFNHEETNEKKAKSEEKNKNDRNDDASFLRVIGGQAGKTFLQSIDFLKPFVCPGLLSNAEVKRRTGFTNEKQMMAFLLIVCNGDLKVVCETTSHMTWCEEWVFYFEWVWGETLTRWQDAASINGYNIRASLLRLVLDKKRSLVIKCRQSWPTFCSYEEDRRIRDPKWNDRYDGKRVVFWDDTNVSFQFMPSDANMQRLTYSAYYGHNCAKGGVFVQLSGWGGAHELWAGATSDTQYLNTSGILQIQDYFSKEDLVEGRVVPFMNILDKGYRSTVAAWQNGKQLILQPDFKKSDRRFRGLETISSAGVATDRSGNERQVKRCKMSGEVTRGLQPGGDLARIDDAWIAFSFQANFMYRSVF